jgi:hypothetical protein
MEKIITEHGFSQETLLDRIECFGGFSAFTEHLHAMKPPPVRTDE